GKLAGRSIDLLLQPFFTKVPLRNPLGVLLQVRINLLHVPAAAFVMADDGMKHIRSVSSRRRSLPHDPINLVNAEFAASAIEAIAAVHVCGCRGSFPALTPDNSPINYLVDVGEGANGGIERGAGDGERLVGATEQLCCNRLAINLE